jgi:type II secretory pathway pseudopilin PulG
LLVVIVIIALLAALITPAVMAAMRTAKRTQISTELSQLHSALEAYKAQYGSYPPSNKAAFQNHLRSIFINIDNSEVTGLPNMDNTQILVFALRGYSPDKRRPITGGGERKPFFDFKPDRLDTSVNPPRYAAPNTTKPYVYFDCSRYPTTNSTESYSNNGIAKPYKLPTAQGGGYANAKSFQIISSGLDNEYGTDTGFVLDNSGIKDAHTDNLTNFSEGKPLIDYIDK